MKGGKKLSRRTILLFGAVLVSVSLLGLVFFSWFIPKADPVYGATFSPTYVDYLNMDWREAYIATLDDLEVRHLRLPIYWSRIESVEGEYDFSEVDWMMDEANARGARVTLVTGMKVPRWPECYIPDWALQNSPDKYQEDILQLVDVTVKRYKNHPALERWQVENEPFFPFGVCPPGDPIRYNAELDLVRELDPEHPIQRTTSGEQSIWLFSTGKADVVGASLYRVVYSPLIGYLFPIPPITYTIQALSVKPFVDKVIISELQAEPWLPPSSKNLSVPEKYALFQVKDLENHIEYARRTSVDEVYLWGIEWWYYLKMEGETRLWEAGKEIFQK